MFKINKLLISLAVASTLVGCSGGTVSATSDQASSSSTDHTSIISRVKSFFKSESQSFTVEMPAASLIIEASKDWIDEKKAVITMPFDFSENTCVYAPKVRDLLGYDQDPQMTLGSVLAGQIKPDDATFGYLLKLDTDQICTRLFIRDSAVPISGWLREVDHGLFARSVFLNGYVANGLATQVMTRLPASVWKSDVEAKRQITLILDDLIKSGEYYSIVADAYKKAEEHLNKDFTGQADAPVHFTIGDYDVSGSGVGTTMLRNGSEWYGAGYISGKKYTISMEKIEVATMKKEKAIRSGESTKAETKVADSAGVSN